MTLMTSRRKTSRKPAPEPAPVDKKPKPWHRKVLALMKAQGISHSELSRRIEIPTRTVNKWFTVWSTPWNKGEVFEWIAAALGTSARYLIDDEATEPAPGRAAAANAPAADQLPAWAAPGVIQLLAAMETDAVLRAYMLSAFALYQQQKQPRLVPPA